MASEILEYHGKQVLFADGKPFYIVGGEVFSAYYISGFVNYIAEKGMSEYKLPAFANCWLAHKGEKPGEYPSGGPGLLYWPLSCDGICTIWI